MRFLTSKFYCSRIKIFSQILFCVSIEVSGVLNAVMPFWAYSMSSSNRSLSTTISKIS